MFILACDTMNSPLFFFLLVTYFWFSAGFKLINHSSRIVTPLKLTTGPIKGESIAYYEELQVPSLKGIYFADLTPEIRRIVAISGIDSGVVTVLSRHTTTGITINEMEARLVDDARQFLLKLAPPAYPYLHNDLHVRNGPVDWPGGDEAWRAQVCNDAC